MSDVSRSCAATNAQTYTSSGSARFETGQHRPSGDAGLGEQSTTTTPATDRDDPKKAPHRGARDKNPPRLHAAAASRERAYCAHSSKTLVYQCKRTNRRSVSRNAYIATKEGGRQQWDEDETGATGDAITMTTSPIGAGLPNNPSEGRLGTMRDLAVRPSMRP